MGKPEQASRQAHIERPGVCPTGPALTRAAHVRLSMSALPRARAHRQLAATAPGGHTCEAALAPPFARARQEQGGGQRRETPCARSPQASMSAHRLRCRLPLKAAGCRYGPQPRPGAHPRRWSSRRGAAALGGGVPAPARSPAHARARTHLQLEDCPSLLAHRESRQHFQLFLALGGLGARAPGAEVPLDRDHHLTLSAQVVRDGAVEHAARVRLDLHRVLLARAPSDLLLVVIPRLLRARAHARARPITEESECARQGRIVWAAVGSFARCRRPMGRAPAA
jgi:hypothetical protein